MTTRQLGWFLVGAGAAWIVAATLLGHVANYLIGALLLVVGSLLITLAGRRR